MKRAVCWVVSGLMVAALVAAVPGCFGGGTSPPSPDELARREINAFLDRLQTAFNTKDADTIINSCFSILVVESDGKETEYYPADYREFLRSWLDMIPVLDCRFDNRQVVVVDVCHGIVVFDFFIKVEGQGSRARVTGKGQFNLFSPAGSWKITRAKQFYSTVEEY